MTFDLRYEYFERETDYNAIKNRNDLVTADPFTIEEDAMSFLNQDGYRASLEARFDLTPGVAAARARPSTSMRRTRTRPTATAPRPRCRCRRICRRTARTPRCFPAASASPRRGSKPGSARSICCRAASRALQWVIGAFYMDEESPVQVLRDNRNTVDFVQSNSTIITELSNTSASVFGQVDYRFADAWALDVGVRYSEDKQEYTRLAASGPAAAGLLPVHHGARVDETTGRVGLKYFAADDMMLYGTVSKGYKAGGVNLDPRLANYRAGNEPGGRARHQDDGRGRAPARQRRGVLFRLRGHPAVGADAGRHAAGAAAEHAQRRAGGDLWRGARADRPVRCGWGSTSA